MSESSIYGITKEFKGELTVDFANSWLYGPMIWDILLDKYMHREIQTPYGYKKSLTIHGKELFSPLNNKVNNCDCFPDRICWEMSNQQIFFTRDRDKISKAIREFVDINKRYNKDTEEHIPALEREHIAKRFLDIADAISEINADDYEFFVFKNTSCDDGVEYWFSEYSEELEEYIPKPISEATEYIAEFVKICNENKIEFISNLDYFKS